MTKKIEIFGDSDNDELLHADADGHLIKIAQSMFDHMESEFRRLNPDKAEEWRLMCGGCSMTIIRNFLRIFLEKAEATPSQRDRFLAIVSDIEDDPFIVMMQSLLGRVGGFVDAQR